MSEIKEQVLEIERLFDLATPECIDIKWTGHHPEYPESLDKLMMYMAKSSLMVGSYKDHSFRQVVENLEDADLYQIKCALTFAQRSERWVTGGWKNIMEDGSLEKLVRKAVSLVSD